MFYSPHMDIFGDTRVMFEFLPSGSIESTELLTVISLSRYPNDGIWSIIRIAMIVFVYMTVIFYVLDDMDTCRLEGLEKYRVIGWPHLDLVNNFLFLIAGIFRLANFIMVAIAFPETATDSDIRQKIRSVGDALYIEDQINGLNGFLLWMKLFKFVGVTRRILRLSDTIIRSLRDSIAYMVNPRPKIFEAINHGIRKIQGLFGIVPLTSTLKTEDWTPNITGPLWQHIPNPKPYMSEGLFGIISQTLSPICQRASLASYPKP